MSAKRFSLPRLSALSLMLLLFSIVARSDELEISGGVLGTNQTWNVSGRTYIIDNLSAPLTIPDGKTLTIGAGVTVVSKYNNKSTFVVQGTLNANGADFDLKTRDGVPQPMIVEVNGKTTFTACDIVVDAYGAASTTTAVFLARGAATLTLSGTSVAHAASSTATVNRAVWTQDTASLVTSASGATRSNIEGFPEAVYCESTTAANLAGTDFSEGNYGVVLNNAAVSLTVNGCSFLNYERALQIPAGNQFTLTNININQNGTKATQIGVYASTYTSMTISGAISNQNIGVHVSGAHYDQNVTGVTFTGCNWNLLVEQDKSWAGNKITASETLPVGHYHIVNPVTIEAGRTLTLQPGTILDAKNPGSDMFVVKGTLEANGVRFEGNIGSGTSVLHATGTGTVKVTDCQFFISHDTTYTSDYYKGSTLRGSGDGNAVLEVNGCLFQSMPGSNRRMMRAIGTGGSDTDISVPGGNAKVTVGTLDGTPTGKRTRFVNCKRTIVHTSNTDLRIDGADFEGCDFAVIANTIGNLFLSRMQISGCSSGLELTDVGVLVSDSIEFVNTLNAVAVSWAQIFNPQISTIGMTFDENSYVKLPSEAYVVNGNVTMRALPYRLQTTGDKFITVPTGSKLILPAGSRVLNETGSKVFQVEGALQASETTFRFKANSENASFIRFAGTGTGFFTQCDFFGGGDTYNQDGNILHLSGDSNVQVSGCSFTSDDFVGAYMLLKIGVRIKDNAQARFESYAGQPCSFANFTDAAIFCTSINNLPYVSIDSELTNCASGVRLNLAAEKTTLAADKVITCPWLYINGGGGRAIIVPAGRQLKFAPGCHLKNGSYISYSDGWFEVSGTVLCEGLEADVGISGTTAFFHLQDGRVELKDSQFTTNNVNEHSDATCLITMNGSSTLKLDNTSVKTTSQDGLLAHYAVMNNSPNASIQVPNAGGQSRLEGFRKAAIFSYGLQALAGEPALTFANNVRDLQIRGGYTLESNLTLPAGIRLEFIPYYGVTTIDANARLALGNGTIVDNQNAEVDPQATLLIKGEMVATQCRFLLRGYCSEESSNGVKEGSDIIRLMGNGIARFTACQFDAYRNDFYSPPRCRIFAVEGNAGLVLNGCFLQTRYPGKEDYPIRSAVRLRESGSLTTGSHLDLGTTFAGFSEAVVVDSSSSRLLMRDAILTRNEIGLLTNALPELADITGNTFIGNTTYAVKNTAAGALNCQHNYWGHPAGPLHPTNPFGLGESLNGNITFVPYTAQGAVEVATLGDHAVGQVPNQFAHTGNLNDVVLLRFSVGGTTTPTQVSSLKARLTSHNGFAADMIGNLRLIYDEDADGVLSDGDDVLDANGVFSFPDKTLTFTFAEASPMDGEYLIMGDFSGLESGDAVSFGLNSDDVVLATAQFLGGACSDASHYLNRLMLSGHPKAAFGNSFQAASQQMDRQLFGFQLSGGYTLQNVKVSLSAIVGITRAHISSLRLLVDTNRNGQEDFGEQWVEASTITVGGGTGTATFIFNGGLPSDSGFVVVGDFVGLERGNTITFGVTPEGVIAGPGVVTTGSAPTVKHTVTSPLMLLDAPFQATNGLIAATQLTNVPLMTFALTPASRSVEGLIFDLYDVAGITAADFTNLRIVVDINQNGQIDAGETTLVGGAGVAAVAEDGTGTLTFNQPFMTEGGDFILVADIANLVRDDTFTITLTRDGVTVPSHDLVEGGVSPVRHAVYRPELPQAALQTNWTLGYRSPGGNTVTGCYSPNGERIVVGYSSGTAFLFDAASNTPLQMFHKHFDTVQYAGFSKNAANAETVVTVTRDGAVYIWNPETAEMENNLFADLLVRYAVPSPDATKLFIVTEGKGMLLDLTTGNTLWEFVNGTSGDTAQLNVADYDPNGQYILVGSADKIAYLLRAEDGTTVRMLSGHSQQVTGANFAANGTVMLTSSPDATITLWQMGVTDPVANVSLSGEVCLGTGISKDGTRFAVVTASGNTRYLRMYQNNGNLLWTTTLNYRHFTGRFSSLRFNPSGSKLLLCSQANNDINYPAALAVQLSAVDGSFIDFVGPRGRVRGGNRDVFFQRVRVSEDGNRIFYMHTEGLDVIFPEFGNQIVPYSGMTNRHSFDITPDGRKLAYLINNGNNSYTLRYLTVDQEEKRLSLLSETTFNYPLGSPYPLTLSRTGGLTIIGDSIRRTFTGSLYVNGPNIDAPYVSAFNADETSWGIAFYNNMAIETSRLDDITGSLEKGVTHTKPYKPVKILYHPDGKRVGCVDEYAGVQFYNLDDGIPVGLYDYRSDYGRPRLHDAALSHDGTMLAVARGNSVKLFDMRTGRVLRYFYPTHSGQAECYAWAVGFGARDNMLWIAWDDSYVEIFQRSRVTGLRLTPANRILAAGRSQDYTVKALYDDGSSVDVTPEFVYRGTGIELAPGARLYVTPASGAMIEAAKVTVNPEAQGELTIEAVYTEGGYTVTANATLTVGNSSLVALHANPTEISLVPGVLTPIAYTAEFSDGYQEKVTPEVELATPTPEYLRITGNNVTVLPNTPPGELEVIGTYVSDGVTKTALTTIYVHGAEARWNRTAVTPGGDVGAMAYSPDGQRLAVGYSSGAVGIYLVGATPTQYTLASVLSAHQRSVIGVIWRSNSQLATLGRDGRICQWTFNATTGGYEQTTEYQHDAVITASGNAGNLLALGDNLGAVTLFSLDANEVVWTKGLHTGEVTAVAVNASQVMSGGEDRRLLLLDRNNGNQQMIYTAFARPPVATFFQGNQMVVLSGDKRLARWDTGTEATNLVEYYFPY
jgi:WD40 repeat protein